MPTRRRLAFRPMPPAAPSSRATAAAPRSSSTRPTASRAAAATFRAEPWVSTFHRTRSAVASAGSSAVDHYELRGTMPLQPAASSSRGFTLIELMVVVVIATILLSIAVPSYMSQIRQSRRTEAKTALLDLAGREERFLTTNPQAYTNVPAQLGYVGFGAANPIGSGYYYLNVCSPAASPCFGVNI